MEASLNSPLCNYALSFIFINVSSHDLCSQKFLYFLILFFTNSPPFLLQGLYFIFQPLIFISSLSIISFWFSVQNSTPAKQSFSIILIPLFLSCFRRLRIDYLTLDIYVLNYPNPLLSVCSGKIYLMLSFTLMKFYISSSSSSLRISSSFFYVTENIPVLSEPTYYC